MVHSTIKPIYSSSKDPRNTLEQINLYLRIGDRSLPTLFSVVDNLAINVLLATTFIDKHILEVLPEETKVIVYDFRLISIIEQGNTPASAVLNAIDSKKGTSKTL